MDIREAKELYQKYLSGKCTPEERALVEHVFDHNFHNERFGDEEMIRRLKIAGKNHLSDYVNQRRRTILPLILKLSGAAALILAGFVYFLPTPKIVTPKTTAQNLVTDLPPGTDKAILVLSNGRKVALDQTGGDVAVQGNVIIKRNPGGHLLYSKSEQQSASVLYNHVYIPKGGQYQITLSDGTKVWLNASSSIRFPADFAQTGNRRVFLEGEAYFEVAHDSRRPFVVQSRDQDVEVLGTHFNINAYADEPAVVTTLLEGSVRVKSNKSHVRLSPGNQIINNLGALNKSPADIDLAVAWKNGSLEFNNADLTTVMRMVSRWYNVDVIYEGTPPQRKFVGKVSRKSNLSSMLKILKLARIEFNIIEREGKTVLIVKS